MGLASSAWRAASNDVAKKAALNTMKKGKTPQQKKVIDFFLNSDKDKGCRALFGALSNMSMQEYIKMVQEKSSEFDVRARAIERIGLDESEIQEIEPIRLMSFVYDGDVEIKYEDKVVVSSQFAVSWIFFSTLQMYTYTYIFDMMSDNTWETTNDFFYSDITCFKTTHSVKENIDISVLGCLKGGENVTKSTYVVDTLDIVVPGDEFSFSMRDNEASARSIQAAKAMLREKKFLK